MRSFTDRLRHALSFELIGLLLVIGGGQFLFDLPIREVGVVAVVGSVIATVWVYFYNYLFDLALMRAHGHTRKSLPERVAHAVLFEVGLLLVLLPFIAWYLQIPVIDAFIMDISLAAFYLVYSFIYNWIYDTVFPVQSDSVVAREVME